MNLIFFSSGGPGALTSPHESRSRHLGQADLGGHRPRIGGPFGRGRGFVPAVDPAKQTDARTINKLNTQINREEETNKWLKGYIEALHHDPKTVGARRPRKTGLRKTRRNRHSLQEPATNTPVVH